MCPGQQQDRASSSAKNSTPTDQPQNEMNECAVIYEERSKTDWAGLV